ncbi:MAG: glycosyltransferase family 87 protein [Vicinamibacterales bacterium]
MKRAALLCAALALLGAVYAFRAAQKMPDFEVYWRAGSRAAHAQPLYSPDDGHYQLKYLPAFALLAVPLAWLPLQAAKAVWFALSAGVLGAFVAMSIDLLPDRRRTIWVLVLCIVLAMAKFYGHELVLGQVNLLLGALVTAAALSLRTDRETLAGLLLSLAIIVKPYAVIFLPWLLVIGYGRAFASAVVAMLIAIAAPAAVYGFSASLSLHGEWWRTVTTSTAPNLLNTDNVSFAAMYAKWIGPGTSAEWLAMLTSIAVLGLAVDVLRRRSGVTEPMGLEVALLLTMMPLLSPQGWDYVLLLATPAIAFLVNYGDRLPSALKVPTAAAVAIAAFSVFDLMGRRTYATFMSWSSVTICFLIVIAALYALRVKRVV